MIKKNFIAMNNRHKSSVFIFWATWCSHDVHVTGVHPEKDPDSSMKSCNGIYIYLFCRSINGTLVSSAINLYLVGFGVAGLVGGLV